jgi:hypothetical protein
MSLLSAMLAGALVLAASAHASRPPKQQEAREIRKDAKLYLEGRGWLVSAIRVSTVRRRYAKAAVRRGRSGPRGEMILHLRHGIWHEVFLGTDGFCSAPAPRHTLDDLGFGCSGP